MTAVSHEHIELRYTACRACSDNVAQRCTRHGWHLATVLGNPAAWCECWGEPSRGFGDTIAKVTSAVGIKPCGGCKERQEWLNSVVPYAGKSGDKE